MVIGQRKYEMLKDYHYSYIYMLIWKGNNEFQLKLQTLH